MHSLITAGYVLHRRPYRETSAIVDVLTADHGKMSFVAKGMQRHKSPLKALLQPLQLLRLEMSGRQPLKTLHSAEPLERSRKLAGKSLYSLFYMNEILERVLSSEEEVDGLFPLYHNTLEALANDSPIEPLLRIFEMQLLELLGYGIDCEFDSQQQDITDNDALYQFTPDNGFIPLANTMSRLNYVFKGKYILAIYNQQWDEQVLRDAKRLTRLALHPLLGGKPLKSKALFMKLELPK